MPRPKSRPKSQRIVVKSGGRLIAIGEAKNVSIGTEPPKVPMATLLKRFRPWLETVHRDCGEVVTDGIDLGPVAREDRGLRLARVYVNLTTETPRPERKRGRASLAERSEMLSAVEALFPRGKQPNRFVFTGEPGSGKSTFFQCVTWYLSGALSGKAREIATLREPKFRQAIGKSCPVPIRIVLREFAAGLGSCSGAGTSDDVVEFVRQILSKANHRQAADSLESLLAAGGAFVLFDGLDEVPQPQLAFVKGAIETFASGGMKACRIAVTCRIASYERPEFQLSGFPPAHRISRLTTEQREAFVEAWYDELRTARQEFRAEGLATECAESLMQALRSEKLDALSRNPFFLSCMAAMHRPTKRLPEEGASLMNQVVDGILEETRKQRPSGSPGVSQAGAGALGSLVSAIPGGLKKLRTRLERIAYLARESRGNSSSASLKDSLLKDELRGLVKEDPDGWVVKVLDALRHRAGLLQSSDGVSFQFAYRFEEFLAGCHLANEDAWKDVEFAARAVKLWRAQPDYSRQVLLWAAGFNAHVQSGQKGRVRDLISKLLPKQAVQTESQVTDVILAADIARDCHLEQWGEDVADSEETLSRLRKCLESVRDGELGIDFPIKVRSDAASAIGRLGDYRVGVHYKPCAEGRGKIPDVDWISIDATPEGFPMGDSRGSKGQYRSRAIRTPYRIARFPVTVAQYSAFVADRGYERTEEFWSASGRKWMSSDKVRFPRDFDPVFQTPNHPRVGVCWHEAVAFCQWLNSRRTKLGVPDNWRIHLPTEPQWERAARHTDGREYPWNDGGQPEVRCNVASVIGHTTAVGFYPRGNAECGASDMAGNVWEWCSTRWRDDLEQYRPTSDDSIEGDEPRVVRGGSWFNDSVHVRCASRCSIDPWYRSLLLGFRVAASPFL